MGVPKFDDRRAMYVRDDALAALIQESIAVAGQAGYASIYVAGGAAAQTITTGGIYEKVTGFTSNAASSPAATSDVANDRIMITQPGVYLVSVTMSFSGTAAETFLGRVYLGGAAQPSIAFRRKIGVGGDVGDAGATGLVTVGAGVPPVAVELYATAVGDGSSFTMTEGSIVVHKVS